MKVSPLDRADNPLKSLRLSKGWTLDDVAASTGVSRHLIIRAEQGCYDRVPPRLMTFYVSRFDIDSVTLNEELHKFQVEQRRAVGSHLFKLNFATHTLRVGDNPITELRELNHLSKAQVTKGLCLHPTIIHKLEKEAFRYQMLPTQFIDALVDAGYSGEWITHLAIQWKEYKQQLREAVVVSHG